MGPLWSWIYAAQFTALACRIITLVIFYYIGLKLVGPPAAFWGTLLLSFCRIRRKWDPDALSDWPHLMCFGAGFLSLLAAIKARNLWLFAAVGVFSGLGYLIRPESIQVVIYALIMIIYLFVKHSRRQDRANLLLAGVLLIAGFAMCTGPYIKCKGALLPKKKLDFTTAAQTILRRSRRRPMRWTNMQILSFVAKEALKAIIKFVARLSENLVYIFMPFMVLGLYVQFRKNESMTENFLLQCFIVVNVAVLMWLYCRYSYMSRPSSAIYGNFDFFCADRHRTFFFLD